MPGLGASHENNGAPEDPPGLTGVALLAYHLKRFKIEKEKRELEEAKNEEKT